MATENLMSIDEQKDLIRDLYSKINLGDDDENVKRFQVLYRIAFEALDTLSAIENKIYWNEHKNRDLIKYKEELKGVKKF